VPPSSAATAPTGGAGSSRASRSLLLTGLAAVWDALGEGGGRGSHRSGLALMVAAAASFAVMAAIVKKMLSDAPMQAVVLSRGIVLSAVFVGLALWRGAPVVGKDRPLLVLRGLLGYAALSCYFWSVQHLPLGDAVLLQYSHPLFVALVTPRLLGERSARGQWWVIALALAGVALVVGPSGEARPAALVGVLGAVLSGAAYVTVRQLSRTEHPLTIMVAFPLATVLPSLLATIAAGQSALPHGAREWAGHGLVALAALVGQVALTLGLARAGAAQATTATLSGPAFGTLLELALFGTVPQPASIAGMLLVLAALGRLGWRRPPAVEAVTSGTG
jgi:drug/metabolite transporter (DMT)-like permease